MRKTDRKCDICGEPTDKIVGKIQFIPSPIVKHSNYTHHADVGVCCKTKLLNGFQWQKRLTAAKYREARRVG